MENELIEKRLPFSMPAEQSLLGAVLIDPASLNEIAALMKGEDFYLEEHKQIYLAMQELFLANREIDVVTLIDMLVTRGVYDKAGGEDYIRTLSEAVPDALNIKDYARIVKEKSILRQLICGGGGDFRERVFRAGVGGVHPRSRGEPDFQDRAGTGYAELQAYPRGVAGCLRAFAGTADKRRSNAGNKNGLLAPGPRARGHGKERPCAHWRAPGYGKDLVCAEYRNQRCKADQKSGVHLLP